MCLLGPWESCSCQGTHAPRTPSGFSWNVLNRIQNGGTLCYGSKLHPLGCLSAEAKGCDDFSHTKEAPPLSPVLYLSLSLPPSIAHTQSNGGIIVPQGFRR